VITGILARHDALPCSTRWPPPMGAILVFSLSHGGPPDHEEQDLVRTHRPTQEEPQPTQGQVLLITWGALGGYTAIHFARRRHDLPQRLGDGLHQRQRLPRRHTVVGRAAATRTGHDPLRCPAGGAAP
jgi:hypothetical protein